MNLTHITRCRSASVVLVRQWTGAAAGYLRQELDIMERWLPVVGYEGWYEVSDQGRVRRTKTITSTKAGRIIGTINNCGYMRACLCKNGKLKEFGVHTIVASAFLGRRKPGQQIDHINAIKTDNRLVNLEYVTAKENTRRAFNLGLMPSRRGSHQGMAKLNEEQVLAIREELKKFPVRNGARIARKYKVCTSLICAIKNKRVWAWL